MVLKLCTGYLIHITDYVWKCFAILSHWGPNYVEKGFSQKWHLVIFPHFLHWGNCKNFLHGHFFEAMVLKLCTGYLVHVTEYVWNFFAILSIRARIMGGKSFFSKVGFSYFFCVEANVRISYMDTFWSYGFQTLHWVFSPYYGVCVKIFLGFLPFRPELLWEKNSRHIFAYDL